MKKLIGVLVLYAVRVGAQPDDPFRSMSRIDWPGPSAYRLSTGEPGPAYWQQRADYAIAATLDTGSQRVTGTVTVRYTNNSPDTLRFVWLQLDGRRIRRLAKRDGRSFGSSTGETPTRERRQRDHCHHRGLRGGGQGDAWSEDVAIQGPARERRRVGGRAGFPVGCDQCEPRVVSGLLSDREGEQSLGVRGRADPTDDSPVLGARVSIPLSAGDVGRRPGRRDGISHVRDGSLWERGSRVDLRLDQSRAWSRVVPDDRWLE